MDPLSIIAGTIAIAGAVNSSLEQVRRFRGAQGEVLSLINEVSDLRLILEEVACTIRERGQAINIKDDRVQAITSILKRAQSELEELNNIINNVVSKQDSTTGKQKVGRLAWTRQKSKLLHFQSQLKDTRITFSTLCSNATLSDLSQIHLQLNKITVFHDDYKIQLENQSAFLESLDKQHHHAAPVSSLVDEATQSSSCPENLAPNSSLTLDVTTAGNFQGRRSQDASSSYSSVQIRATRCRRIQCSEWCSCQCHRHQSLQTARYARNILGYLFVTYSGLPLLSRKCSEKICRRKSTATLKVAYYFPGWMLGRMFRVSMSVSSLDGPQVSLSMPRIVADNADIFLYAVQGNLQGLKLLFEQGLASPFDVGVGTGRSALHYAVNYDHAEVVEFLIHCGANSQAEDHEYATVVALAWRRVFGLLSDSSTIGRFQSLFEDEEYIASRVFQAPHKIVLGISDVNLEQYLQLSTESIDTPDADGRTALSWAAARGEIETVRTLLRFNADPNLPSHWGQTPLHWAAQSKTGKPFHVLQALIESGARADMVDYWNRTALTYASGNHADTSPIDLLIQHGAGLDVRDRRLRTALGYAARLGGVDHAHILLRAGANPDLPDEFNVLPLLEAVKNNYHNILRLLIPISSATSTKPFGSSFLHWVALYADRITIENLNDSTSSSLFDGSELMLTDEAGLTPGDIFQQRVEASEDEQLETSFKALFRSIGEMYNVEEYHDAEEYHYDVTDPA